MSEKTCFIDREKRTILLSGEMDNESIGEIEWALIQIIADDDQNDKKEKDFERKPVVIYINSPGGWVYDTWGLIDMILHSKTPIYTVCTGYAMSSAFKLLITGHKRYCYPHSTLMYHQFSSGIYGKYQEIIDDMQEKERLSKISDEYVLQHTKFTEELLKDIHSRKIDFYMNAEDALKYGCIDKIVN